MLKGTTTATNQDVTKIALEWFERVWNQRDESAIDQLLDRNTIGNDPNFGTGFEEFKNQWRLWLSGFPDLNFKVLEVYAKGNSVVTHWQMSGTHTGNFKNKSATGRKIKIDGVSIDEISNGKIISGKDFWDTKILDQQLGI